MSGEIEEAALNVFKDYAKCDLIPFDLVGEALRQTNIVVTDTTVNAFIKKVAGESDEIEVDPETETSIKDASQSEGVSSTSLDKTYKTKGITFEEFMELILFSSDKQPTEEQLYAALKPLEEPKVYDSGEIGYLIRGEPLREFLQEFGDFLTDEDIKDFMDEFDTMKQDEFYIDDLVMALMHPDT